MKWKRTSTYAKYFTALQGDLQTQLKKMALLQSFCNISQRLQKKTLTFKIFEDPQQPRLNIKFVTLQLFFFFVGSEQQNWNNRCEVPTGRK